MTVLRRVRPDHRPTPHVRGPRAAPARRPYLIGVAGWGLAPAAVLQAGGEGGHHIEDAQLQGGGRPQGREDRDHEDAPRAGVAPRVVQGQGDDPQTTPARGPGRMGSCGRCAPPPPPLCDIPSGCCFFTGPWTVPRSALRMLRRVAAFCRPLRPVLPLVSFPRSRSPVVGVLGLC